MEQKKESDVGDMRKLGYAAIAVVSLAIIVVTGIAVLGGFGDTGLIDNATVQLFITGLKIFGTFIGVIVLAVIGKAIIKLFK